MENKTSIHESPTTSDPLSSVPNNVPNNTSDNPNQPYYDDTDTTPVRLDKKQTNWAGIALIIIGALFFFGSVKLGNNRNAASAPAEWAVFSSNQKHISEANRNLATRSIFGEMEVDLRPLEDKLERGEMHLHVQTVFAETHVIVPDSWQVDINNNAILGEVSNDSKNNTDGTVTLHIEGSTVFGETHISN